MDQFLVPSIKSGDRKLIGSYSIQLLPDEETVITLLPIGSDIVLRLVDFDRKGTPTFSGEPDEAGRMVITIKHAKASTHYVTDAPWYIGDIGHVGILLTIAAESFESSVFVDLSIYVRGEQQDESDHATEE